MRVSYPDHSLADLEELFFVRYQEVVRAVEAAFVLGAVVFVIGFVLYLAFVGLVEERMYFFVAVAVVSVWVGVIDQFQLPLEVFRPLLLGISDGVSLGEPELPRPLVVAGPFLRLLVHFAHGEVAHVFFLVGACLTRYA